MIARLQAESAVSTRGYRSEDMVLTSRKKVIKPSYE